MALNPIALTRGCALTSANAAKPTFTFTPAVILPTARLAAGHGSAGYVAPSPPALNSTMAKYALQPSPGAPILNLTPNP